MAAMNRFDRLWAKVQEEIPGARIVNRQDSAFMRLIFGALGWLVKIFTLGKGRMDWSGFTTTISRTMYVSPDFFHWSDEDKYRLLRHELVHLRQARCWPFPFLGYRGIWRINSLIMGVCYILILPVFFTFRAKFEREGYTQTMLSWYEIHGFSDTRINLYADHMEETFGSSTYFFMGTRKRARRWAIATMAEIQAGDIVNERDNVDV